MMPIHMMRSIGVGIIVTLIVMSTPSAAPVPRYHTNVLYNDFNEVPDDILVDLMARFGQTILRARSDLENSKRTVDFGLARGFSGTQEAKHRMGLAAANFPGGPGRRRRSETEA
ncbi:diuretic hormone class 2 isoform X1 [Episyrphus balteatus]|uniref:diuretic hormone class 2 isoform X1 n=1 Tax=Episyrphus balteatus TaxID=286459 RepID=UPI00248524FD|nr:diuretic hormone class 2 isoform X1 [Episyrphus balteatus]XP_055838367.1 diuretic hormone class 2 isoform X1 [Episyrphus balteatus]